MRIGSLPSKPDGNHAQQAGFDADVLGCPASLVYANETEFRIFDETNCDELTLEGIQRNIMELRTRAWSRENLMRLAPSQHALLQILAPDWKDWGWKVDPKFIEEARSVWGKQPDYNDLTGANRRKNTEMCCLNICAIFSGDDDKQET